MRNRDYDDLFPLPSGEMDTLQREERCRRTLKAVQRAIFMRLFVCAVLIFAVLRTGPELWVLGLLLLVLLISLTGILPLAAEWKKRRKELNTILAEEES